MKKGISLIETLISLTIVGISLVALLPVMTIKQSAYSTSAGNNFFQHVQTGGSDYYCPLIRSGNSLPLVIGNPTDNVNNVPVAGHNFEIYTAGLGNRNVVPLYAAQSLLLNNAILKPVTNGFHIMSGPNPLPLASISYPLNVYWDDMSVVIGNDNSYAINTNEGNPWWEKQTWFDSTVTKISDSENVLGFNLTSLSVGANEFIHISHPNVSTYDVYQVAVGQNVIGKNNLRFADLNFVGIFNAGADGSQTHSTSPEVDFALGNSNPATVQVGTTDNYVLSHQFIDEGKSVNRFVLNATTLESVAGSKTFTAGKLVLASDKRLKTILSDYNRGLKEILNINPVEFVFKNDSEKKHHVGVIAQELKKVLPEAVSVNDKSGYLMVSEEPVFFALINSIKELYDKYLSLKKNNDDLENKIVELRIIRDNLKSSHGGANE